MWRAERGSRASPAPWHQHRAFARMAMQLVATALGRWPPGPPAPGDRVSERDVLAHSTPRWQRRRPRTQRHWMRLDFGKRLSSACSRRSSVWAPQPIEDEHTMKSHPMKTNDFQQALALYIARRPCDAGRLVHLASFAHSAPGAFAAASEHDLLGVISVLVQ